MKGGEIGGKSIKIADKITFEATNGNLTFNATKKVVMIGEQGGVKILNDYVPPEPLRVKKVEGPFK